MVSTRLSEDSDAEPQEQRAIVGGRASVRRYWLFFDSPLAPGPGCLVRSSRITDSWGMRPRLEQDPGLRIGRPMALGQASAEQRGP
jgi:hypothetical protein